MRPPNQTARDQLPLQLARRGPVSAPQLAAQLGVSVPTLHRMLPALGDRLITAGAARRTRHALRRPLRGLTGDLPLYAIDRTGRASQLATLALIQPHGTWCRLGGSPWPLDAAASDGWWDGLPYPLVDMRPQGYLGRQFARAEHTALGVPINPEAWSDDDLVHALSLRGTDLSGNLILGDAAFARWQADKLEPPAMIPEAEIGPAYVALAEQAVVAGVAGSSAAGEFPKFPALRKLAGAATPHVLVKFSGAVSGNAGSPAVQRWADLLVAEHLALQAVARLPGVTSAASRVIQHGGRTFLEVERFDRHGPHGRSPLVSLGTLDAALVGDGSSDWPHLTRRLIALGHVDAHVHVEDPTTTLAAVEHLDGFGRLIANSDMHTGNLSFRPASDRADDPGFARLHLAPVYDMLPMGYAPLPGGEVPPRAIEVPLPLPPQRAVWEAACVAATSFWQTAAQDGRISAGFRALCAAHAERLQTVAQRL